ncbi:MAG: hypothetical protein Tsb0034_04710 [Ekhidna sp.]
MIKITKNLFTLIAALSIVAIVSCGEDNEPLLTNTGDGFDAKLNNADADSLTAEVFTSDIDDGEINVRIALEDGDDPIRRVYVTKNEFGQGFKAVDASTEFGVKAKGDGSIDIASSDSEGVIYNFNFNLTSFPDADGTIVYKFWATKNKGDHRDETKDLVQSVLTLTINLGGTNPATEVISVSGVQLFAPTADLQSESFVSTADGMVYELDDFEFSDLWDIGYSAQGDNPQLSSAFGSPQRFFKPGSTTETESFQELIARETGVSEDDLNKVYFVDIDDSFDFDGTTMSSDLNSLSVSSSDPQVIDIPESASNDIIAFIDEYGKKGVIRIVELVDGDGDGNFFESNDYVEIDIKIQP